jgi:uncharacterized membrane protein
MKVCSKCGCKVEDNAEFCGHCGANLLDYTIIVHDDDKKVEETAVEKKKVHNSLVELICGILSIVFAFSCIIGFVFAIVTMMTYSSYSKEQFSNYKQSKAGFICSIVGLILSILIFIIYVIVVIFLFITIIAIIGNGGGGTGIPGDSLSLFI